MEMREIEKTFRSKVFVMLQREKETGVEQVLDPGQKIAGVTGLGGFHINCHSGAAPVNHDNVGWIF
jgi:hypothetical protein